MGEQLGGVDAGGGELGHAVGGEGEGVGRCSWGGGNGPVTKAGEMGQVDGLHVDPGEDGVDWLLGHGAGRRPLRRGGTRDRRRTTDEECPTVHYRTVHHHTVHCRTVYCQTNELQPMQRSRDQRNQRIVEGGFVAPVGGAGAGEEGAAVEQAPVGEQVKWAVGLVGGQLGQLFADKGAGLGGERFPAKVEAVGQFHRGPVPGRMKLLLPGGEICLQPSPGGGG